MGGGVCCCESPCNLCGLECLQRFADYISRNSVVYQAIYGTDFCTSAWQSSRLLLSNAGKEIILTAMTTMTVFLGKLAVATSTTIFCWVYILKVVPPSDKPVCAWVAILALFLVNYFAAARLFEIFELAVRTIFICFLVDEKVNSPATMLAPEGLKKVVGITRDPNRNPSSQEPVVRLPTDKELYGH